MRLLYKTACWQCDEIVEPGTTTWWDDDRRHATCLACFPERDGMPEGEGFPSLMALDLRTFRRLEVNRTHQRRSPRSYRRPTRRTVASPRSSS